MATEPIDPTLRAEIESTGSVSDAVQFLRDLSPTGPWSVSSLRDGALNGTTQNMGNVSELHRWIKDRLGRANLYWQINPLRRDLTERSPKATLEDVAALARLHVDVDPNPSAPGTLEEQRTTILALLTNEERLKEAGLPGLPSFILDSGGGYWAFWNLIEPYSFGDGLAQERRDRAHAAGGYNKWITEQLNKAFGWTFADDCHNVDRIARLPYTLNIPSAKKRELGRTAVLADKVFEAASAQYSLDQFGCSDLGYAGLCKEELDAIVIPNKDWEPLPAGDAWEAVQELCRRYPNVGQKTAELILQGEYLHNDGDDNITRTDKAGNTVTDRNRAHWRANIALQRAGVPLGLVAAILKDKRFPISEHLRFPANRDGSRAKYEVTGAQLDRATEVQVRKAAGKLIAEAKAEQEALEQARAAEAVLARVPIEEQIIAEPPENSNTLPRNLTFTISEKTKTPIVNERNILIALKRMSVTVSYDSFANKTNIEGLEGFGPELSDAAMTRLRLQINRRFKFLVEKQFFYDVITDQARDNHYHPVIKYLDKLQWDSVPRLDTWLITYGKAKDTPYVRAVSKLMLIAAVRRLKQPGCKFDEMAVLEGLQGTNKSTALKILAINEDWFLDDLPLGSKSKEMIEQLTGKWIIEIADLHKHKGAAVNTIKAQLSRTEDRARLAYERLTGALKRQCVFFGTTNERNYLADPTGERRFWPVHTDGFDIEALKRDRDQLWAEAVAREATGESIRMDKSLWETAAQEQSERALIDPWMEVLENFLGDRKGKIRSQDIWALLGLSVDRLSHKESVRVSNVMQKLGFERPPSALWFSASPGDQVRVKSRGFYRGNEAEREEQIFVRVTDGQAWIEGTAPPDEGIPF